MWMAPLLYLALSLFLWKYAGAVFVPQLFTRSILAAAPVLNDLETIILANTVFLYFGAYAAFTVFWPRLRQYFNNSAFLAGLSLWLINVLILFPLAGRGLLGYRLPQGWAAACFPLVLSHWIFARGLRYQTPS